MPNRGGITEALERLARLLDALTIDWQDADVLIDCVGIYPPAHDSARAMFRADMKALALLGFQPERSAGHHDPQWRIVGHERFGQERRCAHCRQRQSGSG